LRTDGIKEEVRIYSEGPVSIHQPMQANRIHLREDHNQSSTSNARTRTRSGKLSNTSDAPALKRAFTVADGASFPLE
jgi:hypothetical protein